MKIDVAEKLSVLMLQINAQLNDSVAFVRDHSTEKDFEVYRRAVGNVMGTIIDEISNPLYKEHASLVPDGLNGPYKVDPIMFEPRFYEWH
jgi:hypothetical protein